MSLYPTTSQTVGPYLHIGMTWLIRENLVGAGVTGDPITIRAASLDGDGKPVNDALRRDLAGERARQVRAPGRPAGEAGRTRFQGLRPVRDRRQGCVSLHHHQAGAGTRAGRGTAGAAHRGDGVHARPAEASRVTRIYFPDEPSNADDPVLKLVPAERRATLVAKKVAGGKGALEWNVMLQGAGGDGVLRLLTFVTPANAGGQEPPMRLERISPDSGVRRGGDA